MNTYNYMYPCVTCGKSVTEQVTELGMFGITNEICIARVTDKCTLYMLHSKWSQPVPIKAVWNTVR